MEEKKIVTINSIPLLSTKLNIPQPRDDIVSRQRLLDQLDRGKTSKLALISAPAGFGKTTVLSDWINRNAVTTGWISLDKNDNDPNRFLNYVLAALKTVNTKMTPDILIPVSSAIPHMITTVCTEIINSLSAITEHLFLVLEDYHVINDIQVHEIVQFLLTHLPEKIHMIIATRSDPPFPLGKLRIRQEMIEIRAGDLSFTYKEALRFFKLYENISINNIHIRSVNKKTEGWIAGLQMAALSMQKNPDIDTFVKTFSGDDRFILDFLVEEVLHVQSESTRRFLLETAILERLNGPLCDTVTGRSGSHEKLRSLEKKNLFVVPLDTAGKEYRYHHLFGDLLLVQLKSLYPDKIIELHKRAATWFHESGYRLEAVAHSLEAGDFECVASMAMSTVRTALQRGEFYNDVFEWVEALPINMVRADLRLHILRAWMLQVCWRNDECEKELQTIETVYGKNIPPEPKVQIVNIRASLAKQMADAETALSLSHRIVDMLGTDRKGEVATVYMANALNLAGVAQRLTGNTDEQLYWGKEALAVAETLKSTTLILTARVFIGCALASQGKLHKAELYHKESLNFAERASYTYGCTVVAGVYQKTRLGEIYLEWNRLDSAVALLEEAERICRIYDIAETLYDSRLFLARTKFARGDLTGARQLLDCDNPSIAFLKRIPHYLDNLRSFEVLLLIQAYTAGLIKTMPRIIEDWIVNLKFSEKTVPQSVDEEERYLILVRYLIITDNCEKALSVLEKCGIGVENKKRICRSIELHMLRGLALYGLGESDNGISEMEKALNMAKPEGYVRLFLDEGKPMEELLRHMRGNSYAKFLLSQLTETSAVSSGGTVVLLTERELDVLRCIAEGHSNRKISDILFVSANTVKTHLKNINVKLDAANRTEAVSRARKLGII